MDYSGEVYGTRTASEYETLERIATLTDEQEAALNRGDLFLATLLSEMTTAPMAAVATRCTPTNALWASALQEHATELHGRVTYAMARRQAEARRAALSPSAAYGPGPATPSAQQGLGWYA